MKDEDRRRHLPPNAMLQSFQTVARYDSVSRAAAELCLTQSAVSRQIAQLEAWLGLRLFDRPGRRVILNSAGKRYADEIAPALARIRRATAEAIAGGEPRAIELATLPSFGMRWLAPRLGRLSALHPDLIVNTTARSDEFDFDLEIFDAAIHVGRPDWPGVEHDLLFKERVVPVASPSFIKRHGLRSPVDFATAPLLVQSRRPDAWQRWFSIAATPFDPPRRMAAFSHFLMLTQAAVAGAGVALLPSFLIQPELCSGSLIIPVDLPLEEDRAYYFVAPPMALEIAEIRQLRAWIVAEAAML